MTVSSENRRNDYEGTGAADTFQYTFPVLRKQDLRVLVADSFGAETTLTVDVDYTVRGVGTSGGGEIVLTAGPLPAGYHLTLLRDMRLTQPTDLRNQGGYSPEVVETSLDRVVMTLQQQQEELNRAVKVRASSTEHPDTLIEGVKESEAAAANSADTAGKHRTTAGRWATQLGATVVDTDSGVDSGQYSAREHAIGEAVPDGSARQWAQKTSGPVEDGGYSAKMHAVGDTPDGSAKDWASKTDGPVAGGEYSAKKHAQDAKAEAKQAAAAAASAYYHARFLLENTDELVIYLDPEVGP